MTTASLVVGTFGVITGTTVMYIVRKDRLHPKSAVFWMFLAVSLLFFGFVPGVFDAAAKYLGIKSSPSLAFTVAFALVLLKLLRLDIENTRLRAEQRRLAQLLAIRLAEQQTN